MFHELKYNRARHKLLKVLFLRFPKLNLENYEEKINYSETGLLYREIDSMFANKDINRELLLSELYKSKEIVQFTKPELGCFIEENNGISALSNRKYLKENRNNLIKFITLFGTIFSIMAYSFNIYNISKNNDSDSIYNKNIVNFSDNIRGLLKAEDKKNFQQISTFYADNIVKYWNSNNINKSELRLQYKKAWSISLNPKNVIVSIDQIDNYTYVLKTVFKFYDIRQEKYKTIKNSVRYVFNKKGKIIKVLKN